MAEDNMSKGSDIVNVQLPTFSRFRKIVRSVSTISLLRGLEYERFQELGLKGRILDFGGGEATNYSHLVSSWMEGGVTYAYESANIDPSTKPTYLLEEGGRIPCDDKRFDYIISWNTFEHIYDNHKVFKQLRRVIKDDGKLYFVVPFMFRVHGHPNDFVRGTPAYWASLLGDCGFNIEATEALVWGGYSTASTVTGLPGPFKKTRLKLALLNDLILSKLRHGSKKKLDLNQDHPIVSSTLAYFISAIPDV